ncbi:MAG: hypothetical protein AAFO94_09770 [Bacteroidota bacterium]
MKRFVFVILLLGMIGFELQAQGFAFGIKGGPTVGFQNWDGSSRDPLFKYHGILFIESAEEGSPFSLFAQAGYHIKGSAVRYNFRPQCIDGLGNVFDCDFETLEYQFRNASLTLGGKKRFENNGRNLYYLFGLRGDFTINTNLEDYNNGRVAYFGGYPLEGFVRKLNYGVTLGGGIEFPISDLVGAMVELTINPDFSRQYFQPPIPNVTNPFNGQSYTIPEREIRNVTLELTVGFRFLRKVIYIDEDDY